MPFLPSDETAIARRVFARLVARSSGLSDFRPDAETAQLVLAFARELAEGHEVVATLRDARVLERMVGRELDDYATEVGARARSAGKRATVWVQFSRSNTSGALTLGVGTVVARADGISYRTQTSASMADGIGTSASVRAVADAVGTASNGEVATVVRIVGGANGGVVVTNPVRAEGGTDAESNDEYREAIRRYTRTLARCNDSAIRDRILQATLDEAQVLYARRLQTVAPNVVEYALDDGAGTLENAYDTSAGETLLDPAVGGEIELYGSFRPWRTSPAVTADGVSLAEGTDYTISRPEGRVRLLAPATAGVVYAIGSHTYWVGLVAEANRLIYGDPADLVTYPPYVAIGGSIVVKGARKLADSISGTILVRPGYDRDSAIAKAKSAVLAFVNRLDVGEPRFQSQISTVAHNADRRAILRVDVEVDALYPEADQVIRIEADDIDFGPAGA